MLAIGNIRIWSLVDDSSVGSRYHDGRMERLSPYQLSSSIPAESVESRNFDLQGGQLLTCTPLNLASFAAKASSLALKSLSLCSSSSLVAPVRVVGALPSPLAVS